MNRFSTILLAGIFLLLSGTVYATNITIKDLNYSNSISWYGQQEDQEVEPGMVYNQNWDLEGFFINGKSLSLVGGYDFKNGLEGYNSGDIFIDTDELYNTVYGGSGDTSDGNRKVNNSYGYDYVLDLNWTNKTYDVYSIGTATQVVTAYYHQNQGSSPWQFNVDDNINNNNLTNGVKLISSDNTIDYHTGLTDADTGFLGDTNNTDSHNKLVVDLGFLLDEFNGQSSVNFTAHYTMGCGNDNIMGRGVIPNPEPATLLLFGFGLLVIARVYRRKNIKMEN